jgi:hypothetical protein
VGLAQDPLVEDANVADHKQPQVRHDEVAEVAAGDVIALDVEPEALAPERPAVGEVELEVEFDAVLIGFAGRHGWAPFVDPRARAPSSASVTVCAIPPPPARCCPAAEHASPDERPLAMPWIARRDLRAAYQRRPARL